MCIGSKRYHQDDDESDNEFQFLELGQFGKYKITQREFFKENVPDNYFLIRVQPEEGEQNNINCNIYLPFPLLWKCPTYQLLKGLIKQLLKQTYGNFVDQLKFISPTRLKQQRNKQIIQQQLIINEKLNSTEENQIIFKTFDTMQY